jgi:outer membrane protein TolC
MRHAIRRAFPRIAFITVLIATSGTALAAGATLTLGQAQQLAVERSRQLQAKDYAITASQEMAVAASQLPDPMLKAGVDNLPVNGADRFRLGADFMTMRYVGVSQEVTRADKRKYRAERFERESDKTAAEKTATVADIQRDTALAWLERFYAEAMAAVIAENATQSEFEIQAAEGAYRAGRGNQADLFAAKSALATYHDRASQINRRISNAKVVLARWVGADGSLQLAGKPAMDTVRLDAGSLDTQLAHHPRIAILNQQEAMATAEAKLAKANKKSDWSVEVMYQQRGSAYDNMISFGVSVPLQWDQKNRQDRELAAKLAMVEQVRAERDDMLRAHVAETRAMFNEWENGRERLARYNQELVPLAKERTLAALASYRGGKGGLTDVLMARRNEIDVRLEALQLEAETARQWAELNFLFPDNGSSHISATQSKEFK